MTIRRSIRLASRPKGEANTDNFRLQEDDIPVPAKGEVLVRVIWMSLDPYMRGRMSDAKSYAAPVEVGAIMEAGGVAEVMISHHPDFEPGDIVTGQFGWTSHATAAGAAIRKIDPSVAPLSAHLGVLGMPGITAWVGLNDILGAKQGETIVVSAATGAVGGVAGQLARARGMNVIGVAGGAEKCAYAVEALGYHACLDHRAADAAALSAEIAKAAPNGVNCYFENVGGKTLSAVLPQMAPHGRIAICGMIAWYEGKNLDEALPLPVLWRTMLTQKLRAQGFIVFDYFHRFPDFIAEVGPMVADGRVTYREDVAEGLEAAPEKFLSMLRGGNFGKTLVRVGPDP